MTDPNDTGPLPSISHARVEFAIWLAANRPWSAPGVDVYAMIERMVDQAAWCFRSDHRPTKEQIDSLTNHLYRLTEPLATCPDGYDGPCMCAECRSSA